MRQQLTLHVQSESQAECRSALLLHFTVLFGSGSPIQGEPAFLESICLGNPYPYICPEECLLCDFKPHKVGGQD